MAGLIAFGTVPASPASRLLAPAPATAPCTWRKLTARLSRHETRCMAMAAPFAWIEMIAPRKRKAGTSTQKSTPKSSASPGDSAGTPTHPAAAIRPVSKMPRPAATRQPTTIPASGPQNRRRAEPRSISAAATTIVASAVSEASSGSALVASSSRSNTTEASVMDRIIITVPPTVGVTNRLRMNSHRDITICTIAERMTSVARVAGPPSTSAVMQKGMANAAVNIGSTAPAPTNPSFRTWMMVESPTTTREANTIQVT